MSKTEQNTDITLIIPIFNVDVPLLKNAIESVANQVVKPDMVSFVVGHGSKDLKTLKETLKGEKRFNHTILSHNEDTSFQSQMNYGVKMCKTKWFSYLEQDDEISTIWFKNVIEYREAYEDVGLFLPLILDVSESVETPEGPTSDVLGISNEAVWAAEFSTEMGVLDNDSLLKYQNFNFDGMVMMKEVYEDFGGLKNNIKLTFMYEFLLRMTAKTVKTMVIPKLGYKHVNLREDGLFSSLKNEMLPDEARWWLATAKREYFHTNDRELTYEKIN
jgi:glycosyltransferase involved in cell wall biosynthesis